MTTQLDYVALSAIVYNDKRGELNQLPNPPVELGIIFAGPVAPTVLSTTFTITGEAANDYVSNECQPFRERSAA